MSVIWFGSKFKWQGICLGRDSSFGDNLDTSLSAEFPFFLLEESCTAKELEDLSDASEVCNELWLQDRPETLDWTEISVVFTLLINSGN